jgi:hypothetical protein
MDSLEQIPNIVVNLEQNHLITSLALKKGFVGDIPFVSGSNPALGTTVYALNLGFSREH